jgi:outer membrane protein assembly factor BamB
MFGSQLRNALLIILALVLVAWAAPGTNPSAQLRAPDRLADARQQLLNYVAQQRLTTDQVQFEPASHDWRFVAMAKSADGIARGRRVGTAGFTQAVLAYDVQPAGMRPCLRAGPYSVQVRVSDPCPGEWLAYRADGRSSGTSTFRLNWNGPPAVVASVSLNAQQAVDPLRMFAHNDARLGERLYINNGSSLEAFDANGQPVWRTPGLGVGEIIDVTDVDSDGEAEVLFSSGSRLNPRYPSGAGPGELFVLAARDGAVLWRYAFAGIEFGLNRRRTTIVANADTPGKSIYAVLTYSEHLWRFDFSAGARNGVVRWKSPPLNYDSPDKAPLVADFDGDGTPEVVIDCSGALNVIRISDGAIVDRLRYATAFSFGGFLAAVDLDGDGSPEIVGTSNSIYMKDAFAARYTPQGLALIWRKQWEAGLERTAFEMSAARGVISPAGSKHSYLVWSVRDMRTRPARAALELIDAATGKTVHRIGDASFLDLLRSEDGAYRVVAARAAQRIELITVGARGFGAKAPIRADRWYGVVRAGRPGYLDDAAMAASSGLFSVQGGEPAFVRISRKGRVDTHPIPGKGLVPEAIYAFEGVAGVVLAEAAGKATRLVAGERVPWATYAPQVFGAPIIGDIDGDGTREVVVPFRRGSGIARFSRSGEPRIEQLVAEAPEQQRESFYVPVIAHSISGERVVVAYESGPQLHLSALNATGKKIWSAPLPQTNWEPSLVIGSNAGGGQTVFYNDSRLTTALDAGNGAALWQLSGVTGECQRQIATIDWNEDGVADVAIQTGAFIGVFDGATGAPLASRRAQKSFGGYVAASRNAGGTPGVPTIATYAVGGLTLMGANNGRVLEAQLDDRKVESIPAVIGNGAEGKDFLFQISGAGRLRVLTLQGRLVAERALNVRPLAMTGAYVDGDDVVDLLIGTYRGELIAISGATLKVLWQVQFDGPVGPAVATDIYGDGRGEVVLITGDGRLRVLASK